MANEDGIRLVLIENGESADTTFRGDAISYEKDPKAESLLGGGTKISSTRYIHYGSIDFVMGESTSAVS